MKLPCELIRDLLPLYHDGVCSEVSTTLVAEHLKDCEHCSGLLKLIDAEIELPKPEPNVQNGLLSIQKAWKKSKLRAFLLGFSLTAAAACALWWFLFEWYCVTVTPEEIFIGERSVLDNGRIVLEHGVPYPDKEPHTFVTEDGVQYTWYQRPLFWKKLESHGTTTSYWDPEAEYFLSTETHSKVSPTAWYFGKPGSDDLVLFWEAGMELPPASEAKEEQYRQIRESFEAPNAPAMPAPLNVVTLDQDEQSSIPFVPGGNIEETVVPGPEN